jgi:hypothetical protein
MQVQRQRDARYRLMNKGTNEWVVNVQTTVSRDRFAVYDYLQFEGFQLQRFQRSVNISQPGNSGPLPRRGRFWPAMINGREGGEFVRLGQSLNG